MSKHATYLPSVLRSEESKINAYWFRNGRSDSCLQDASLSSCAIRRAMRHRLKQLHFQEKAKGGPHLRHLFTRYWSSILPGKQFNVILSGSILCWKGEDKVL